MATSASIPTELWLMIFQRVPDADLWLNVRKTCRRFRACADDIGKEQLLPGFTLQMNYTLGSGSHHRWYDVRGGVRLQFAALSTLNPQYAEFDIAAFTPERCQEKALAKWHSICVHGIGPSHVWRVTKADGGEVRARLSTIVVSGKHGIWCDWREMLVTYYSPCEI